MKYIVTSAKRLDQTAVGGKFAKQSIMSSRGMAVPTFFCLSKDFYIAATTFIHEEVKALLTTINFADQTSIRATAESIKQLFLQIKLTKAQTKMIFRAFDRHFTMDQLVSVRASTVGNNFNESEDSSTNAFAGMSESFLYVTRDQIINKILACWASGFCEESLIYRFAQGYDLMGFAVAVGIQKMIFGEKSFVMFTCNPETAQKNFTIAASYGIGEGVVQEAVPIDHYFVGRLNHDVRREIVKKDSRLTLNRTLGFGLMREDVPIEQQELPCLSEREVLQLVKIGCSIEELFNAPQDIEGTIDSSGNISILQARPIVFDGQRQKIWSNANITESFPGVTTALTYSFAKYFYRIIFHHAYTLMDVPAARLHDNRDHLEKMIGYLSGRTYYSISNFYYLHKQTPLFPLMQKGWEKTMMVLPSSYHTPGFLDRRTLAFIWALLRGLGRFFNHDTYVNNFHAWWETTIAPLRGKDFSQQDPQKSVATFSRVWSEVGNNWGTTLMNDSYIPILNGAANKLLGPLVTDEYPGIMTDLLCGGDRLRSVEIMLSAVALGEMIQDDVVLADIFAKNSDEGIWSLVQEGRLCQDFCAAFKHHLHFNGDRGLQELKMEQPNLRDNPTELIKVVRQYALNKSRVAPIRTNELAVRAKAETYLWQKTKTRPWQWIVIKLVMHYLRKMIRNRENSRYCRSELFGFSKKIFYGLGDYFVSKGILCTREDVFHLTQEEIFGYIDGTGVTENLQALVDLRRSEYEANKEKVTAEQITTMGAVRQNSFAPQESAEEDESILKGLPSSSGKVIGLARVINNPTKAPKIAKHEILIAKETDPGWLFLMMASCGIIAEKGSIVSHTAITGRKFNIPTIVGVKKATTMIPDGALIEMNGATGFIRVIDNSPVLPPVGSRTAITINQISGEITIKVLDEGHGQDLAPLPPSHAHPRIF